MSKNGIIRYIKRFLRRLFKGIQVSIGKIFYNPIIAFELAVERALDFFQALGKTQDQTIVNLHLTAVIKTFERPKLLRRLLASIKHLYPSLRIIVVDDSRNPVEHNGVQTIVMPFDSGNSAGRNEGMKFVTTKYFINLDDDYIFDRHTRLEQALDIMERHPEIDMMGGPVINLPFYKVFNFGEEPIITIEAKKKFPPDGLVGGLTVFSKVSNFFIGRTERVRSVGWEPAIKIADWRGFYDRMKEPMTIVFNQSLQILHARTPFNNAYMQKRNDIQADIVLCDYIENRTNYLRHNVIMDKDEKNTG